jgi:protein-tyrosine phosphatase
MSAPISVLFVCLGNICRSPTAEATFVAEVARRRLEHRFRIDSCGTGDWHVGEAAHPETRRAAERHGVLITHRARTLVTADFDRFDWLLAMDRKNERNILRLSRGPEDAKKVHLFRRWDPVEDPEHPEVPDPYFTGEFDRVFELCARTSRALCDALLDG